MVCFATLRVFGHGGPGRHPPGGGSRAAPLMSAARPLVAALVLFAHPALAAIEIQRVTSPGGIEAWLVEDRQVPVVSVEFLFPGGAAHDPIGREGRSDLVARLLDQGAGPYDAQAFQGRLEDRVIGLGFSAGRDVFRGSVRTLTRHLDEAVELARLALTTPRFDPPAVAREREAALAGLRWALADPQRIARRVFAETVFDGHVYGRPRAGTLDSVAALAVDDLRAFVAERFARNGLLVAVAGDIAPDALGRVLDRLFGDLPATTAADPTLPPAVPGAVGEIVRVAFPTPQTVMMVGHQGLKRDDPAWYAGALLNYVLGGGGFSSRLMAEVRESRGLSYGVYSALLPMTAGALVVASGSSVNARAGETLEVIRATWRAVAEGGITAEELADAKAYLTGSFPLSLSSTSAIAQVVLQIRRFGLGIDHITRRDALIEAVTLDQVNALARRLLVPAALTTVVVGAPVGVTPTRTIDPSDL